MIHDLQRRIEDFLGLPPNSGKLKLTSKNNAKTYPGKEMIPSCPSQNKLGDIFQPSNENLLLCWRKILVLPFSKGLFLNLKLQPAVTDTWFPPKTREPGVLPELD